MRPVLALVLALPLAACAETGDFGRRKAGAWNDTILPAIGAVSAGARGEHVSRFALTDDETQMRDRAWRFLMPAHERSHFQSTLRNLVYTRIAPFNEWMRDRTVYARANAGPTTSPVSRYRRITDDATADHLLVADLARITGHVLEADVIRMRTLERLSSANTNEVTDAMARVDENAGLAAWICWALDERIEAFRYALSHLVVEAPHRIAIESERAVDALSAARDRFCPLVPAGFVLRRGDGGVPAGGEPIIVKG